MPLSVDRWRGPELRPDGWLDQGGVVYRVMDSIHGPKRLPIRGRVWSDNLVRHRRKGPTILSKSSAWQEVATLPLNLVK